MSKSVTAALARRIGAFIAEPTLDGVTPLRDTVRDGALPALMGACYNLGASHEHLLELW